MVSTVSPRRWVVQPPISSDFCFNARGFSLSLGVVVFHGFQQGVFIFVDFDCWSNLKTKAKETSSLVCNIKSQVVVANVMTCSSACALGTTFACGVGKYFMMIDD